MVRSDFPQRKDACLWPGLLMIFVIGIGKHDVGSLSKDGRHHSYAHSAHSARNHRSSSFQNLAYS